MKPVLVSEPASQEIAEAVRWHDERRPGWGARLFDAVSVTLQTIERHPEIGSPRKTVPRVRQLPVRGFPYIVVYRVRVDDIDVVAVAHTRRRPGYWKHRG